MPAPATLRRCALAAGAVLILLALRLPFLPPTLEDVDSVNFDLGVHEYNPAIHQPHPPGYPLYIAFAKASHAVISDHATALASLAAVFSALAVIPLFALMRNLTTTAGAVVGCILTMFSPLFWLNSVRPMSDMVGFCAVTTAQALLLRPRAVRPASWHGVAFLCGAVAGIRLQSLLLTLPLLVFVIVRDRRAWLPTATSVAAGLAAWVIPLVVLMGGPGAAAASFAPVVRDTLQQDSLLPQWTLRSAAAAAGDVVLSPWHDKAIGGAVVALAAVGTLMWAWTGPRRLAVPFLAFVPYLLFHYAVQDTGTLRYSIPTIPLFALLASIPFTQGRMERIALPIALVTFIVAASAATLPALGAYDVTPSPMMQALDAVATRAASERVVVSGHFAFERYLPLLPDRLERLPLVHAKEWQSLTAYWTAHGRRDPVLFLREAHRTDHLQFGRDTQTTVGHWEWPAPLRPFLKAARPGKIDLVRLEPPRWTIESGAFVTDEAGPYARVTGEPLRVHIHPARSGQVLIVSGSIAGARAPAHLSLRYGETFTQSWRAEGFFTLRTLLPPVPSHRYVPVSLDASVPVAITDVWVTEAAQPAIRPAKGFHLAERDEAARLFRWVTADARATAYLPSETGVLTIEGWIPPEYDDDRVTLSLEWNGRPAASLRVDAGRFRHQLPVRRRPADPWSELRISSSHSFVPADVAWNGDRRDLSLRIYELRLDPD